MPLRFQSRDVGPRCSRRNCAAQPFPVECRSSAIVAAGELCNPQEGTMRLGLLLMTFAFALGVAVIGARAAPLTSGGDAPEALLEQVAYEICKPLDDANTVSVCRPADDDEVDDDDDDDH